MAVNERWCLEAYTVLDGVQARLKVMMAEIDEKIAKIKSKKTTDSDKEIHPVMDENEVVVEVEFEVEADVQAPIDGKPKNVVVEVQDELTKLAEKGKLQVGLDGDISDSPIQQIDGDQIHGHEVTSKTLNVVDVCEKLGEAYSVEFVDKLVDVNDPYDFRLLVMGSHNGSVPSGYDLNGGKTGFETYLSRVSGNAYMPTMKNFCLAVGDKESGLCSLLRQEFMNVQDDKRETLLEEIKDLSHVEISVVMFYFQKHQMLKQNMSMVLSDAGFKWSSKLYEGITATNLVLTMMEVWRKHGVKETDMQILKPDLKLAGIMETKCSKDSRNEITRRLWPNTGSCSFGKNLKPFWKPSEVSCTLIFIMAYLEGEGAEVDFVRMSTTLKKLPARYYTTTLKVYSKRKMLQKGKYGVKHMADNRCQIGSLTWNALSGRLDKLTIIVVEKLLESTTFGALAYATRSHFEKYMLEFYKYLKIEMQKFKEYQVCGITTGFVDDVHHALDEDHYNITCGVEKVLHNYKNLQDIIGNVGTDVCGNDKLIAPVLKIHKYESSGSSFWSCKKHCKTCDNRFNNNLYIVETLTEAIAKYCHDAFAHIISNSVNSRVSIAAEILKQHIVLTATRDKPTQVFWFFILEDKDVLKGGVVDTRQNEDNAE